MKKLTLLLLIAFLLSSCASASTPTPTNSPAPTLAATSIPVNTPVPTNTSAPTITPTPLPITFVYQDNVPASARAIQEQGANKAYVYYSQYADLGPITIYTFQDINLYIDKIFPAIHYEVPTYTKQKFVNEWITGGGGNGEAQDVVFISTEPISWQTNDNPCYKQKNVAHELFHTLQSRLMHHGLFRPALDYGPEWLKEGSAEIFGNQIADGINGCSYQSRVDSWVEDSGDKTFALQDVDGGNFDAKVGFWSVAPLAVIQLIKNSLDGERSVINYYSKIGNGANWHDAFKTAFGISVEDFYTQFAEYRKTIQITLDASACLPQTSSDAKCLGRKPSKPNGYTYVFDLPYAVNTDPKSWDVKSNCGELAGYGTNGSFTANYLYVDVGQNIMGDCHITFTFSKSHQITVSFIAPVDTSIIDKTVCKDSTASGDFTIQCIGRLPGVRIFLASSSAGGNQHIVQYVFDVTGFDLASKSLGELGISSTCELISWEVSGSTILILDVNSKSISKDCTVTVSPNGSSKSAQVSFLSLGFMNIPTSTPTTTPTIP